MKGKHRKIANDATLAEAARILGAALAGLNAAAIYVCCGWRSIGLFVDVLTTIGIVPKACIVWDKERGVQNLDRYFKQHEFVLYAGPYGGERTLRGDVWRIPRDPSPPDQPGRSPSN